MSAWSEYKKKMGETRPWHVLNPVSYGDEGTARKRMDICDACPQLIQATKQCKECGCFMVFKTKLTSATCPIGKW